MVLHSHVNFPHLESVLDDEFIPVIVSGNWDVGNVGEAFHINGKPNSQAQFNVWWQQHISLTTMPTAVREETCLHFHVELHPVQLAYPSDEAVIHAVWLPVYDKNGGQILSNAFGIEWRKLPTGPMSYQIALHINGTDIWTRNSFPTPSNLWTYIEYDLFIYYSAGDVNTSEVFMRFVLFENDVKVYDGQDDIFDNNDHSFFQYFIHEMWAPCSMGMIIISAALRDVGGTSETLVVFNNMELTVV